jgi:predicted protein tyrosine phosphatase
MIIVCPFHAVPRLVDRGQITHVMSLLGPETPHLTLDRLQPKCHLQLTFHDIAEPLDGFTAPRREDVETILGFVTTWKPPAGLLIARPSVSLRAARPERGVGIRSITPLRPSCG